MTAAALFPISLALAAIASCASAPAASRRVDAEPDRAFTATERALAAAGPIAERDARARRVATDWFEVVSDRTEGLLIDRPWRERVRVEATIEPERDGPQGPASRVSLAIDAERKPRAGARAYRYERTEPPPALAAEILDAIERALARDAAAPGDAP